MKLTFENSRGEERVIGEPADEEYAFKMIQQFIEDHNFKSYYTRTWHDPELNRRTFDVGSHTEFFHLYYEEVER